MRYHPLSLENPNLTPKNQNTKCHARDSPKQVGIARTVTRSMILHQALCNTGVLAYGENQIRSIETLVRVIRVVTFTTLFPPWARTVATRCAYVWLISRHTTRINSDVSPRAGSTTRRKQTCASNRRRVYKYDTPGVIEFCGIIFGKKKNTLKKISRLISVVETPSVQVLAHCGNVYARLSASRRKSTRDATHRRRARASVYSTRIARGSRTRGAKRAAHPSARPSRSQQNLRVLTTTRSGDDVSSTPRSRRHLGAINRKL